MSVENGLYFLEYVKNSIFDFAHDSYRVPVLNTNLRFSELIQVIDNTPECYLNKSISPVLEEIKYSISNDLAFKKIFENNISQISSDLSSAGVDRLRLTSLMILGEMRVNYIPENVNLLRDYMSGDLKKSNINYLANNIVSQFLSDGYSKRFIRWVVKKCFSSKGDYKDGADVLNAFLENFDSGFLKYKCCAFVSSSLCFYLKGLVGFQVFEDFESFNGVEIDGEHRLDEEWLRWGVSENKKNISKRYNSNYLVVADNILSKDQYSAQANFEKSLNQIRSIAYASGNEPWLGWKNRFFVVGERGEWTFSSESNVLNKRHLLHENVRKKYFRDFVHTISDGMLKDNGRALRCFSSASTAFRVNNKESQLVSLWSSLETILPDNGERQKSNIEHYTGYILPLIMIQYLNRIMSWVYFDVKKLRRGSVPALWKEIDDFDDEFLKFCAMITMPEYKSVLDKVGAEIKNETLLFRVFLLYKNISSVDNVVKCLERHQQLVFWQIQRIYRRRNGIVHNGYGDVEENLLLNFNEYWLNVMRRVSVIIEKFPHRKSLDDVFEIGVEQYKQYQSYLSRRKNTIDNGRVALNKDDVAYIFEYK